MKFTVLIALALLCAACANKPPAQATEPEIAIPENLKTGPWSVAEDTLRQLAIQDAPGIKVWTFSNKMGQPCIVTYGDQPLTASCGAPEAAPDGEVKP